MAINFPFQYERLSRSPIDVSAVFDSLAEFQTYIASGPAYAGQVVAVRNPPNHPTLYSISEGPPFSYTPIANGGDGETAIQTLPPTFWTWLQDGFRTMNFPQAIEFFGTGGAIVPGTLIIGTGMIPGNRTYIPQARDTTNLPADPIEILLRVTVIGGNAAEVWLNYANQPGLAWDQNTQSRVFVGRWSHQAGVGNWLWRGWNRLTDSYTLRRVRDRSLMPGGAGDRAGLIGLMNFGHARSPQPYDPRPGTSGGRFPLKRKYNILAGSEDWNSHPWNYTRFAPQNFPSTDLRTYACIGFNVIDNSATWDEYGNRRDRLWWETTHILDFRDVGPNCQYRRWFPRHDKLYNPTGVTNLRASFMESFMFWRNNVHNPNYFAINYEMPDIPFWWQNTRHPPMNQDWPGSDSRWPTYLNRRSSFFLGSAFEQVHRSSRWARSRMGQYQLMGRINDRAVPERARMFTPAGQVIQVDFRISRSHNLCLVNIKLFQHPATFSNET